MSLSPAPEILMPAQKKREEMPAFRQIQHYIAQCINAEKKEFFIEILFRDMPGWNYRFDADIAAWLRLANYKVEVLRGGDGLRIDW